MAINTINWTDKVTFTGGEAQQFVLNDTWSNYFNPTTADVDFTTITADGSLSYRIYDTFVGEMQAKNWDSSVWTDLTADFSVSKLGKDDTQPQFVYIREWDGEGTEPDNYAISIYQVFVDSYNPDSITEDLGEYDVNGNGWSKTNAQVSVASATDANAAMNSGIQTVTPNGTDYIYYVSIDDGANWIELAQDGSNIPEIGDTGHGSNGNVWVKAIDKAGNAYEKHVDALYIDTVQATISDIVANGTVGEDGWIKAGSDVTFEFLAKDYEGSGVDIVSIATWDAENEDWVPVSDDTRTDDGGESWTAGTTYTWTNAPELLNYEGDVQITVLDLAGNETTETYAVKIDTTAAVLDDISVTDPDAETGWYNIASEAAVFTITASDNLSGVATVQFAIDGETWTDALYDSESEKWIVTAADTGTGAKEYTFRVIDNAGNVSAVSDAFSISQDTVAPDASTWPGADHKSGGIDNNANQPISGYEGEWVTDMNFGDPGTFSLSGLVDAWPTVDTGSELSVSVTYDVKYQLLEIVDGVMTWSTVTEAEGIEAAVTYDAGTGEWSIDPLDMPLSVSGRYEITVTVKDAAGNSTANDIFYVDFDNTQPPNPTVTLMDGEEEVMASYATQDYSGLSVVVGAGSYAGEKEVETAPASNHFWATTTGADPSAFVIDPAHVVTTDTIEAADFNDYWAGSVVGDSMEDDAYMIAFYDQNSAGTFCSGASDPTSVTYTRFIIDTYAPIAEQISVVWDEATAEYFDGTNTWYNGSVIATFEAKDKWKGTIDTGDYKDHVSGVASFIINDEEVTAVDWQYSITVEEPGIHSYSYSATDNAGNSGSAVVDDDVRIDTAAPVVGDVFFSDGTSNVKQLVKDDVVYINADELGEIANFQIVTSVVDVNGETDPEKDNTGVGLDLDITKSFYVLNDNPDAAFVDAEGQKTAFAETADAAYTYVLTYEDHLEHAVTETYTVVIDTTPAEISVAGTYTQDGVQADSPKGPEATAKDASLVPLDEGFGYSSAYDLTFTFTDATSGVASWTLTKGEETIKTSEDAGEVVGSTTFNSEYAEALQLEEGENTYTITVLDNAGNETTQDITIRYDVTIDGTVTVKDNNGDEITANADGKYYVSTTVYSLTYAQDDEFSGNGNLFIRENGEGDYNPPEHEPIPFAGTEIVKDITKDSDTTTDHNAWITDKAGNQMALDATVVVDTAFESIKVLNDTDITVSIWQIDPNATLTGDAPTIAVGVAADVVAGNTNVVPELTIAWTTSLDEDGLVIRVEDTNLSSVTVTYLNEDPVEQEVSGSIFDYTITQDMLGQGENKWTIVGTDKAGNSATSIITINFDNVGPEIGTLVVDGAELPSTRGGVDQESAFENPVFVDDISNFTFVVNAEDVTSGVQGTYYSFSSDFETWTDWDAIEEPFTEGGYYRFAVADNAGNSTITEKYYYVTLTPEVPRQPVITYTVGSVVYTDVNNKGWFDTELTVNALFENYVPGYDQTHYVAKKFDSVAYQQAMSEAVTQEDEANALLAAIHFGEADQDDYLMDYATTTQSDPYWNWTEDADGKAVYYMFSIEESTFKTTKYGYFVQTVLVDTKAPVVTLDTNGYVNKDGDDNPIWTNKDVRIDVTATDVDSGLKVTPSGLTLTAESADVNGTEVSFTAIDNLDHETVVSYTAYIDKTAPVIERTDDYADGTWSTEAVTVSANAFDALSGLATASELSQEVTAEGETIVNFEAEDNAGNKVSTQVQVLIDTVAPTLSFTTFGYVSDTWTNQNVSISVEASDATSGIAEKSESMTITEEGEQEVTLFAKDVAGNETSDTVIVKIDKTAPVITRTDNYADGTWSTAAVTVTATAEDALSGLATASELSQMVEAQGETIVNFEAEDNAGNKVSTQVQVLIDTVAPTLSFTTFGYVSDTWTNQNVSISVEASDATSGIAEKSESMTITEEGEQEVTLFAKDVAGNETSDSIIVKIDKTAPVITRTDNYADGTWSTSAVTITATASDALSGLATASDLSQTVEAQGETIVNFEAEDNAGNKVSTQVQVLIDTVGPNLELFTHGYVSGNWTNQDVSIAVEATDATSGIAEKSEGTTITAEGEQEVTFFAKDVAGNETSDTVIVKIDKTAPVITRTDNYADGTWSTSAVTITATASDALSGLATASDLSQEVTAEGETIVVFEAEDNAGNKVSTQAQVLIDTVAPTLNLFTHGYVSDTWTNQDVSIAVEASDATSGIAEKSGDQAITAEGTYELTFTAKDVAGNETSDSMIVKIDKTGPSISVEHTPADYLASSVTVTATFADALSGIASQEYSFDNNNWTAYTGSFTVTENAVLYFRAADEAGNVVTTTHIVDNITVDAEHITGSTSQDVQLNLEVSGSYSLTGTFGDITGKLVVLNDGKKVYTGNLKNGVLTSSTSSFMLDNSKASELDIQIKSGYYTQYDIELFTNDTRYTKGDNGDDTVLTAYELDVEDTGILFTNWVGFGDRYDYRVFTLETASKLNFEVAASDGVKFTVYQKLNNGKLKKIQNFSVKAGDYKTGKALWMDKGTYYISMEAGNKKSGSADYAVALSDDSRFFPQATDNNTLAKASNLVDNQAIGWVGFGDSVDYYKFTVDSTGRIALDMDETTAAAVNSKQLKLTCYNAKGKSVSLTMYDNDTMVSKKDVSAGLYYLGVTCTNVKKYDTNYKVTQGMLA